MTTIERVEKIVCEPYCVAPEELQVPTRRREIVEPRQICMVMLHKGVGLSSTITARQYTGRTNPQMNHSTVLHAIKTTRNLYETDKVFAKRFDKIATGVSEVVEVELTAEKMLYYAG
jgi:chromosomal replication initiator protein